MARNLLMFKHTKQQPNYMKKIALLITFAFIALSTFAQTKYLTRTGNVSFFSHATLEDITANSHQATALLNSGTGALAFKIPIKSFEFEKALMQEHFNENYMQSAKFPQATFNGAVTNNSTVNYTKSGTYKTTVKGKLTIHGVTKDVEVPGEIIVDTKGEKITTKTTYIIALADYGIKNDKANKIAENIEIRINTVMPVKK